WLCSVTDHVIIARMLALDAHPMRGKPYQRIEPEKRDSKLRRELSQSIEPFHVRHFVHENKTASLFRPFIRIRRKKNCRINNSPRHGNSETVTVQKCERTRDSQSCCHALSE